MDFKKYIKSLIPIEFILGKDVKFGCNLFFFLDSYAVSPVSLTR